MSSLGHRFGAVVRGLRDARGWSQEQLAGRAELNRSYLGEVERGDAMPSLATVEKLALALQLSPAELMRLCEVRAETRAEMRAETHGEGRAESCAETAAALDAKPVGSAS